MSKYDVDICAWCEKPLATDTDEREWDRRWKACGSNDDDPELNTWRINTAGMVLISRASVATVWASRSG